MFLNALLALQGRHYKLECVNRIYDGENNTIWTSNLYGSQVLLDFARKSYQINVKPAWKLFLVLIWLLFQMALYEQLLASPYRTTNGEEADYFFVPVLDSCIITRADDAPHLSMQVYYFAILAVKKMH